MKALIVNKNYKLYFIVTFFSFCTIFSIFIFNGYIVLKQIDSIDLKIIGKNQQSQGYEIWFKPENISEFKIISGDFVTKENNVYVAYGVNGAIKISGKFTDSSQIIFYRTGYSAKGEISNKEKKIEFDLFNNSSENTIVKVNDLKSFDFIVALRYFILFYFMYLFFYRYIVGSYFYNKILCYPKKIKNESSKLILLFSILVTIIFIIILLNNSLMKSPSFTLFSDKDISNVRIENILLDNGTDFLEASYDKNQNFKFLHFIINNPSEKKILDYKINSNGKRIKSFNNNSNGDNTQFYEFVQEINDIEILDSSNKIVFNLNFNEFNQYSKNVFLLMKYDINKNLEVYVSNAYIELNNSQNLSKYIQGIIFKGLNNENIGDILVNFSYQQYNFIELVKNQKKIFLLNELELKDSKIAIAFKIASIILFFCLMYYFLTLITYSYKIISNVNNRKTIVSIVFLILFIYGIYFLAYPGIMGWDGFSPYIQYNSLFLILWYGIGYPLIQGGLLNFSSISFITFVSVTIILILLLFTLLSLIINVGGRLKLFLLGLFFISIPFTMIPLGMLTHLRDATNGILMAALVVLIMFIAINNTNNIKTHTLVGIIFLSILLAILRIDNIPTILILLSIFYFLISNEDKRTRWFLMIFTSVIVLFINPFLENILFELKENTRAEKNMYQQTAYILPLIGLLSENEQQLSPNFKIKLTFDLDQTMDVNYVISNHSPYHMVYWHEVNTIRGPVTNKMISEIRKDYFYAVLHYPIEFVKLRYFTFLGTLNAPEFFFSLTESNFTKKHPDFLDRFLSKNDNFVERQIFLLGLKKEPHINNIFPEFLIEWTKKYVTSMPQILILVIIFLLIRFTPIASMVAFGVLIRIVVFFFFEPASVPFYLFEVNIIGFLLPFFTYIEYKNKLCKKI